jgi:hypothetical protein
MADGYSITFVVGSRGAPTNPGHSTVQINGPDFTTYAGFGPTTSYSPYSTGQYDVISLQNGQSPVGIFRDPRFEFQYVDSSKYLVKSYTFEISRDTRDAVFDAATNFVKSHPNYNFFDESICTDFSLALLHAAMPNTDLSKLSRIPDVLQRQLDEISRNGDGSFQTIGEGGGLYTVNTGLRNLNPDANAPNFSSAGQRYNQLDQVPFNYASGGIGPDGEALGQISLVRYEDGSGQLTSAKGTVVNFGPETLNTFSEGNGVLTIESPTTGPIRFISVDPITGAASISGGYQASGGSTISVAGNSINVVQQQSTGTQTTTVNWEGELERIQKLNNDLSSSLEYLDPKNTHSYDNVVVSKNSAGQVTAAQVTLDPNVLNAGMSIGQIFGSALGAALGGNSLVGHLAGSTIGGLIGQKFVQVLATSLTTDLSTISLNDVFASQGISIANAGIGAASSFLTAELGHALRIDGFDGQLFNTAVSGFTTSMLTQITTKMSHDGLDFAGAIAAMDWSQAVSGAIDTAGLNLENLLGSYFGHELVPAETREGVIGGEIFGAIGGFILPGGPGALIGTIIGTTIGNHLGTTPSPSATDLLAQAGDRYGYRQYQSADGGHYDAPDKMAAAAVDIVNSYFKAAHGVVLDQAKQVTIGYTINPDLRYIIGVPARAEHSFIDVDDTVRAAALDVLQNSEVIGGDLLLKRAHQNSSSHTRQEPVMDENGHWTNVTPGGQLITMAADLSVAQDYENYLNNRAAPCQLYGGAGSANGSVAVRPDPRARRIADAVASCRFPLLQSGCRRGESRCVVNAALRRGRKFDGERAING